MRAAAPPFGVTVFAVPLNVEIGPDQEWHWAIVQAKGYPPQHSVAQQKIPEQGAAAGGATAPAPDTPIPALPLQPNASQGAATQPSPDAPAR
jgi:hypothetical protein